RYGGLGLDVHPEPVLGVAFEHGGGQCGHPAAEFAQDPSSRELVDVSMDRHMTDAGELDQVGHRRRSTVDDEVRDALLPGLATACGAGCITAHDGSLSPLRV